MNENLKFIYQYDNITFDEIKDTIARSQMGFFGDEETRLEFELSYASIDDADVEVLRVRMQEDEWAGVKDKLNEFFDNKVIVLSYKDKTMHCKVLFGSFDEVFNSFLNGTNKFYIYDID